MLFFLVHTICIKTIHNMLKNVKTLKLIKLKFVLYCFLPYLCIIIKGVIKYLIHQQQKNKKNSYEKERIIYHTCNVF